MQNKRRSYSQLVGKPTATATLENGLAISDKTNHDTYFNDLYATTWIYLSDMHEKKMRHKRVIAAGFHLYQDQNQRIRICNDGNFNSGY